MKRFIAADSRGEARNGEGGARERVMTDIQFLSTVTGFPVNVSDPSPVTGKLTLTAWGGDPDGIANVTIALQVRPRQSCRPVKPSSVLEPLVLIECGQAAPSR